MKRDRRHLIEWLGLGAALLAAAALAALFLHREHRRATTVESAHLAYSVQVVEKNLLGLLEIYDDALESIAGELAGDPEAGPLPLNRAIRLFDKALPGATGFAVVSGKGIVVATSDPALAGQDLAADADYQRARQLPPGRPGVQPAPRAAPLGSGAAVLILHRALPGTAAGAGGLVMLRVDRGHLARQLDMLRYAPEVSGALLGADGALLLLLPEPAGALPAGLGHADTPFGRFMAGGARDAVLRGASPLDGETRLFAFRRLAIAAELPSGPLVACVSRPLSAILAEWFRLATVLAAAWGVLALFAAFWLRGAQRQRLAREGVEGARAAERARAEAALQEGKAQLEAALDAMSDAVFISDLNGNFIHFNQAFATFHRFHDVADCARTLSAYPAFLDVHSADGERLPLDRWAVPRALRGETGIAVEFSLHRRDTGDTWIGSYNYAPIRDAAGAVIGAVVTARDITGQRQVAEALRMSEQLFRAVFEHAPVGISIANLNTRIARTNRAFQRLIGYTEEELRTLDFPALVHPDDRAENLRLQQELISGARAVFEIENRFRNKQGETVWVRKIVTTLPDPEGQPAHSVALILDMTERRRLEEALRISEIFFRTLYEHAPIGIAVFHAEDGVERANSAFCAAFGYEEAELKDLSYAALIHPDERAADLARIALLTRGECQAVEAEVRCLNKDGQPLWMRTVTSVLPRDEQASTPRYLMMLKNIDGRKAAERLIAQQTELLAASEEKFRATFEQAPIGIAHVSRDGHFLLTNRALSAFLGRSAEELVDISFRQVTYPPDLAKDLPYVAQLDAGEIEVYATEKRYLHKDGTPVWAHLTLSARRLPDGSPDYRIAIIEDIRERKRAEEALNRSQAQLRALTTRLQEIREEERTALARTVHDELGQLVTGISLNIAGLRRLMPADVAAAPALDDKFADIGELMAALVARIREIASELRPGILDAIGLPAALRYEATRFAARADIACVVDVPDAMPPVARECSTMLFRVFQELLANIGRHAGASEIRVSLDVLDDVLVLEVCDNGRGITEAELGDHGAIGLLGIRERVARWDGEVEFFGHPGEGTAVLVTIPLDAAGGYAP